MRIMTCNIRCFGGDDGEDAWPLRADFCTDVIRSRQPDIICFQEMWAEQFTDLRPRFDDYDFHGIIDEPQSNRPMNSVFYRRDRFTALSTGGYWLSTTPHVTGSKSWDSVCVRLATWIRFHDADGWDFRVVNTHLDHIGQEAREQQAALLVEDAAAYPPDYPQVLTGDLNCDARNPAMAVLFNGGWHDTYRQVHGTDLPGPTYHEFDGPGYTGDLNKIDWVLVRGAAAASSAEIVDDARPEDGRFPSDHYFVTADISPVG
jgi:endonuclease/exonuclease/phosphatase family metal-dependent hydrolase